MARAGKFGTVGIGGWVVWMSAKAGRGCPGVGVAVILGVGVGVGALTVGDAETGRGVEVSTGTGLGAKVVETGTPALQEQRKAVNKTSAARVSFARAFKPGGRN